MPAGRFASTRGLSLIELLVATAILTVSLVSLVPLFTLATGSNAASASTTGAAIVAQQKLEQLRALPWSFDPGADGLVPSPAAALEENTVGYVDYIDARGRSLDSGSPKPPRGTSFTCRWSIEPLAADPANTLVIQVLVIPQGQPSGQKPGMIRVPGAVRLVTVRTRKQP